MTRNIDVAIEAAHMLATAVAYLDIDNPELEILKRVDEFLTRTADQAAEDPADYDMSTYLWRSATFAKDCLCNEHRMAVEERDAERKAEQAKLN